MKKKHCVSFPSPVYNFHQSYVHVKNITWNGGLVQAGNDAAEAKK